MKFDDYSTNLKNLNVGVEQFNQMNENPNYKTTRITKYSEDVLTEAIYYPSTLKLVQGNRPPNEKDAFLQPSDLLININEFMYECMQSQDIIQLPNSNTCPPMGYYNLKVSDPRDKNLGKETCIVIDLFEQPGSNTGSNFS